MINSDIEKNFKRLKEEQDVYMQSCNERIQNWNKFKNDYTSLQTRLKTLPNELNYDIMVPISKMAFMPGKLVHTNEILVLLGDNWFTERSAHQACEIIDRRLVGINNHLNKLLIEKNALIDQIKLSNELHQDNSEFVNIEEKIDENYKPVKQPKQMSEEEKKELRRKQQERAMRTQTHIDERLKQETKNKFGINIVTDSDDEDDDKQVKEISKKVSDLNLESNRQTVTEKPKRVSIKEQSNLTFEEMLKEYEQSLDRDNNNLVQGIIEKNAITVRSTDCKKVVKWSDDIEEASNQDELDKIDDYDYDDEDDDDEEEEEEEDFEIIEPIEPKKTSVIKIKHTKDEKLDESDRNRRVSRDKAALDNPADVYSVFYKPKSILKQRSFQEEEETIMEQTKIVNFGEKSVKPESDSSFKFEPLKAFTGEIVEREFIKPEQQSSETVSNKPVSRFKASKISK